MSTTPRRLDKYELHTKIGRGSIGEVWKGRDLQLQRDVAIKLLHTDLQQANPHFFNDFTTAGTALSALHQDHLVPLREVNVYRAPNGNETVAYIVMDYIEGLTCNDYLKVTSHRGQFPSIHNIVYLYSCLGEALDYTHSKGIIHGDIKPKNILLQAKNRTNFDAGEPLLVDTGFCPMLGITPNADMPFYISPEQAGGGYPNTRSDIYALGALLYEICTGVPPFRGESPISIMMQHVNALPTPPNLINPNVPAALSEVILHALAKDPIARFASASLLATAIAEACSMRPSLKLRAIPALPEPGHSVAQRGPMINILGVPQPFSPQTVQPPLNAPISRPLPALPPASQPLSSNSRPLPTPPTASQSLPGVDQARPSNSRPLSTPPATSQSLPGISQSPIAPSQRSSGLRSGHQVREATYNATPQPTPAVGPVRPPEMPAREPQQATHVYSSVATPRSAMAPQTPPLALPPRRQRVTDKPAYVFLIAVVLLLMLGGAFLGIFWLQPHNAQPTATINNTARVFFQDDALGHNDVLHLQIDHISAPAQGKSYFAWLETETKPLPLGTLPLQNNAIIYTYPGDTQHTDLLNIATGVLITLEQANTQPQAPGQQHIYHGVLDPKVATAVKNILSSTPGLENNQSVIVTLFETIKSMNDKTGSIADTLQNHVNDKPLAMRQAIRVIEMLDGSSNARQSGDLPQKLPSQLSITRGLLSSPSQKGYLDILDEQVQQVKQVAGGNKDLLQRVQNTEYAIQDLRDWLQKVRANDVLLLKAADLADPANLSIALQLKQAAADSYTGRTIPPNQSPQPLPGSAGANQAYIECQYMAAIDLQTI
ncbi:protein kinase domain-containing protein [Ktedonobacter racemifer]|uniref:non-specific serine/threonine protein kinase n=1 Tax=Ktedonobacter racemifer DSM 44963 TaxID=485913 RepID=D6TML2_KTERA|nr:protein kinase [Ktedonobacter racemifer]EFH87012.1 serine/threonine protein kinase [Ktedonobacter racemifer DSM 44963]